MGILCDLFDLFGMVKWARSKNECPPTRGSKENFESPAVYIRWPCGFQLILWNNDKSQPQLEKCPRIPTPKVQKGNPKVNKLIFGMQLGSRFLPSLKVQIFSQKTRIQVRFLMTNVEPPDIFFGGGRGGRRTSNDRVDLQKVPPKNPKNLDSGSGFFSRIQTIRIDRSGVFFLNGWMVEQVNKKTVSVCSLSIWFYVFSCSILNRRLWGG